MAISKALSLGRQRMTSFKPGIGISNFIKLYQQGRLFVDKSALIARVIEDSAEALLLPRPRRFGKTLNLSMLQTFFEDVDGSHRELFTGLEIETASEEIWSHFQCHPVITLSFKEVKSKTWDQALESIHSAIAFELNRLETRWGQLPPILEAARQGQLTPMRMVLKNLSSWLQSQSGQPVLILIDEYDEPIHSSWVGGYYEEAIDFFRTFLSAGLKDNPTLFKGAITGILRIAKESIFSGLNNIGVYSLMHPRYATDFGFTEAETRVLVAQVPAVDFKEVQTWYDGYHFADHTIYNPWSVLCYLDAPDAGLKPYWLNTSSNELIHQLLTNAPGDIHRDLMQLIKGHSITQPIEEAIALRELESNTATLWSLLLFSGYLSPLQVFLDEDGHRAAIELAIPNKEVNLIYQQSFSRWLRIGLGSDHTVSELCRAILNGDAETFEELLHRLFTTVLSYHDLTHSKGSEAIYQAFILGLLVTLRSTHQVSSNREAGFGRYDILIAPRDKRGPGAILELKVLNRRRKEAPEQGLERAKSPTFEPPLRCRTARARHRPHPPIRHRLRRQAGLGS